MRLIPGEKPDPAPEPDEYLEIDGERVRVPTWEEMGCEPPLDLANPLARRLVKGRVQDALRAAFKERPELWRDWQLRPRLVFALRARLAALAREGMR